VVHYGSVTAAAGVRERVPESLLVGESPPRDPVAASLRRAEALLARAWDEVPSTLLRVATVVVRYRREGFDATVAKVGGEIARGGAAALLASLAIAALILPLLIKSRRGATQ
jgi:hypothetical protein